MTTTRIAAIRRAMSGRTMYEGRQPRDDEVLVQEIDRLRAALTKIAERDVPRKMYPYRMDGKTSKNDQCQHDVPMYNDCAACTAEFALSVLNGTNE